MNFKKKKIGILTFHDGINHGAFFQAFFLYSFLKKNKFNAHIINYKNKKHLLNEYKSLLLTRNPIKIFYNIKKILSFKEDQKLMNLGPKITNVKKISEAYGTIIVGSDIVWNYELNSIGKDPVYFANGLSPKKWISYAPSFGAVRFNNKKCPNYVKNGLKKFSNISVRDEHSKKMVKKICGKKSKVVLDPTLIFDSNGMEKKIRIKDKFLLVYANDLRKINVSIIKNFALKNSLKVVAVAYSQRWADYNIIDVSPFEWLGYFKEASYVFTSTFHGTLFSIKYKKNFITLNNEAISNKVKTILSKLNLSNRLIDRNVNIEKLYKKKIDYVNVEKNLLPLVNFSREFILNSIIND